MAASLCTRSQSGGSDVDRTKYGALVNYTPYDLYDLGQEIGDSFVRRYRDQEINLPTFKAPNSNCNQAHSMRSTY